MAASSLDVRAVRLGERVQAILAPRGPDSRDCEESDGNVRRSLWITAERLFRQSPVRVVGVTPICRVPVVRLGARLR